MNTKFFLSFFFLISALVYSQSGSINNTLGSGGSFIVKDGSATFLTLSQATGYLSLNNSLTIPATTNSSLGVIFKGTNRFIHDYKAPGTTGYNTFVGINSGNFTLSGGTSLESSYNTGVGVSSLEQLTTGSYNSAVGSHSLSLNTTGDYNSAFGYISLYSNNTGNANSAFGYRSLSLNTVGSFNSAFGYYSLYSNNTTGSNNSAFGSYSLQDNTTGGENSAFGFSSLTNNTTGSINSAFGYGSLSSNNTGSHNSAFGSSSLSSNSTGSDNSAFGYGAGAIVTDGHNLTVIGNGAEPSSGSAINEITLGNGSVTSLRCNVTTITALSDARDKKNVKDLSLGLDFILKLKPRQFNWDRREWYEDGVADGSKMQEKPTAGFIAQELDELQRKENAEWLDLVLKNNPDRWEATAGNLFPVVVKAIQELNEKNEQLIIENESLKNIMGEEIAKLKEENTKLRSEIEKFKSVEDQISEIKSLKSELTEQIKIINEKRAENESDLFSVINDGAIK